MKVIALQVALVPNVTKKDAIFYAKKVIKILLKFNINVIISEKYKKFFDAERCSFVNEGNLYKICDIILTLGGDGTLIHAANLAATYTKPILGINLGKLGFVTEVEKNELYKLHKLVQKDYAIEDRMLLEVSLIQSKCTKNFYALNDAVISSALVSNLIETYVALDGEDIQTIRADGLIIATPTGSTAYALSAGGPIIDPTMRCIALTPICAHSLFARPMIFSESSTLTFSFNFNKSTHAFLTIDGSSFTLNRDDTVKIRASSKTLKLIKLNNDSFCKKVTKKLAARNI